MPVLAGVPWQFLPAHRVEKYRHIRDLFERMRIFLVACRLFCCQTIDPSIGLEYTLACSAGMAKLVDAPDSKSGASNGVPVRLRLPVHSSLTLAFATLEVRDSCYAAFCLHFMAILSTIEWLG